MKKRGIDELTSSFKLLGGIGVCALLLMSSGCKKVTKTEVELPSKEVIIEHLKNDSIRDLEIDSLRSKDLLYIESNEQMTAEIAKLKHAFDSIEQSNKNLNNYIKHQDKMIKK